jgi:acyl carrier protein
MEKILHNEEATFEAIKLVASLAGISVHSLTSESSTKSSPEWDSLVHMELITTLEGRLQIELSSSQMATIGTIRGVATLLEITPEN